MRFTRPRDLVAAGVVAAVAVHLLFRLAYGSLPVLPTLTGGSLAVFAAAEAAFGFSLRARIERRPGTRPVEALTAAKAVAVAKASSMAGAICAGGWLGVLGYVIPRRGDFPAAASDAVTATVGMVCAGALVAAALWLEHCCRTPEHDDGPAGQGDRT